METEVSIWIDVLLAASAVGLGWAAVTPSESKRAVVWFIAFGLLLALVWARLRAPDLALAEAAIGSGLSGALLLAALRDASTETAAAVRPPGPMYRAVSALIWLLAIVFGWALVEALTTGDPVRLSDRVSANLAQSGVSNPVTAVLLNFRAYDTLLELAVLLAAVLGVVATGPSRPGYRPAGPLLSALVGWLVPLLIVSAGYLLWVGGHAPGGAFQAGALLAAVAVLVRLAGRPGAALPPAVIVRWLLVSGTGVFLAVGLIFGMGDRAFLQYPVAWSGVLILLIESVATLSIAATLALAYVGGWPSDRQISNTQESTERQRLPS